MLNDVDPPRAGPIKIEPSDLPPGGLGCANALIQAVEDPWLRAYGGFLSHRATPSHHPFLDMIFHYKPSSYGGTPFLCKPPYIITAYTHVGVFA